MLICSGMDYSGQQLERDAAAIFSAAAQVDALRESMRVYRRQMPARERGYFLPDEDRQVKILFGVYLRIRGAMLEIIRRYWTLLAQDGPPESGAFAVGICAAGQLVNWSTELVRAYEDVPVVRRKLNEADPAFGLQAGQFELIRDALNDLDNLEPLARALAIYRQYGDRFAQSAILPEATMAQLRAMADGALRGFEASWHNRLLGFARLEWRRLRRDTSTPLRDAVYAMRAWLCEAIGNSWLTEVTPAIPAAHLASFSQLLEPGDFFVVRPEEKLSTVFLPGWWTHVAVYCGSASQLGAMGWLEPGQVEMIGASAGGAPAVIEALAAGVVVNSLEASMRVDHCAAIRVRVPPEVRREIVREAFRHYGKPYDFSFDFSRADRLVCTELLYRSLDGRGGIRIEPTIRLGHPTVSADDLISMVASGGGSPFDCAAISSKGEWLEGPATMPLLMRAVGTG